MSDEEWIEKQRTIYQKVGKYDLKKLHDESRKHLVRAADSGNKSAVEDILTKLRLIREEALARGINANLW